MTQAKILDIKIEYMIGWANSPHLKVLVNKVTPLNEFRFIEKDGCYFAQNGDEVRFFFYKAPGRGYGGRVFHIQMKDGEHVDLIGPWSSNAGTMSPRFIKCLDVSITDEKEVMQRGHTFYSGAVTLEAVQRWLDAHPDADWEIHTLIQYGNEIYIPKPKGIKNPCPRCKGTKKWRPINPQSQETLCSLCDGSGEAQLVKP